MNTHKIKYLINTAKNVCFEDETDRTEEVLEFFQKQYNRISNEINSTEHDEITYVLNCARSEIFEEKSLEDFKTNIIKDVNKYIKLYNKLNN